MSQHSFSCKMGGRSTLARVRARLALWGDARYNPVVLNVIYVREYRPVQTIFYFVGKDPYGLRRCRTLCQV